ncbi:MAG: glycoside hydrolase family 3 N-terminal domain-containing protein [Terriglobia bacterium]
MKPPSPSAVGEFLMLRVAAPRGSSSLEQRLRTFAPGGILLTGPLPPAPETLYELLGGMVRSMSAAPILALEAGGGENPLSVLLPPLPSLRALAEMGARRVLQAGELVGEALTLLGFNTYFAVSLDLSSEFTGESLGGSTGAVSTSGVAPGFSPAHASGVAPGFSPARAALKDGATFRSGQHTSTFSADPRVVAECGAAFAEGLARHKILAVAGQFPGLGGVPPARDGDLFVCGRSMAELWRRDLVPYRELLPRLPLVMMSTAAYKAYDFDYPRSAVLSEDVVEGLLRAKLGYRGVVVAPQLETQAVRGGLDMGDAAVQSLSAGCDMLLVEHDDSWQAVRDGIEEALASGVISRPRLEQSVARIHAAKKGCAPPKGPFPKKAWKRLARRWEEFNSGA